MTVTLYRTFFSVGFRPFYLGAAAFACLAVPLWLVIALGLSPAGGKPGAAIDLNWHIHEMLFGFAPAVIAGFLLTAVRAWTGRPTPSGTALALLFGLWAAARIALLVPVPNESNAALFIALLDASFLPALALSIAIPLWQSRNYRNAFVLVILALLTVANLVFHARRLGIDNPLHALNPITVGLDVVGLLMIVIGGRVIPAFSANAVAGLQPRRWLLLEVLAIGAAVLITLIDLMAPFADSGPSHLYTGLLWLAGVTQSLRLLAWQPWRTHQNLLLLALPLAYAWIPVHFLLRAALGGAPGQLPMLSVHALVVGAMAALMLAMMTRSALGHTGRALRAGVAEGICFAAIHCAAVFRVAGPLLAPQGYQLWITLAGIGWTVAFASFVIAYAPMLMRPRIDHNSR
ncbi:MAG: NnrS family protein [Pseudomonadales bacterium]